MRDFFCHYVCYSTVYCLVNFVFRLFVLKVKYRNVLLPYIELTLVRQPIEDTSTRDVIFYGVSFQMKNAIINMSRLKVCSK
jgi:hypothetical protein